MSYTYADYKNDVGDVTHGKIVDAQWLRLLNRSVREVVQDHDLKSLKRKATLSPFLFDDIYDYSAPSDLKGQSIIDIAPQANRSNKEYTLTSPEEFDRKKTLEEHLLTVSQNATGKTLRVSAEIDDTTLVVSELDSITSGGGTWQAFGDGTNLTEDSDYFIKGSASINYGINGDGGTTAGIQNTDLDTFDITEFIGNSSVFVWVYVSSTTGLTNFILKIGNDSNSYYSKTVTTTNEGTSFVNGWNLLRFDFSTATQTGTVDLDACKYVAIYMTKAAEKINETDYRFDYIQIKKGRYSDVLYYSQYPWTDSTGVARKENSTATTDLLVANSEEYNLFILKAKQNVLDHFKDIDNLVDWKLAKQDYQEALNNYKMLYPSEAKVLITNY